MGEEDQSADSGEQDSSDSTDSGVGLGDQILDAGESDNSAEQDGSGDATGNDDGGEGGGGDGEQSGQVSGAPESYDAFNTPDGFTWSDEANADWATAMKEGNHTQEAGQKLLDTMASHIDKYTLPGVKERQDKEHADQVSKWKQDAKDDPILGGQKGEKLEANAKLASNALAFIDKALQKDKVGYSVKDTLTEMGWLDHPATMHALVIMGRRGQPDSLDAKGDPGFEDDWDSKEPHDRMGWDDMARPMNQQNQNQE